MQIARATNHAGSDSTSFPYGLLVFLTLNFGLGGALLAVFIAAMKLFRTQ